MSRRFQIAFTLLFAALVGGVGYSQHGLREIGFVSGPDFYGSVPVWVLMAVTGALIGIIFGGEIDRRIDRTPPDER